MCASLPVSVDRGQEQDEVLRQYPSGVHDFSSQYGIVDERTQGYTVLNLVGKPSVYPKYGDFSNTCQLRTYGPWWKQLPSKRRQYESPHIPQTFISEDFVELEFEEQVYPTAVELYETYNPGTVVRILALDAALYQESAKVRWFVLWSGVNERQAPEARIFRPTIKKCPFSTKVIRLEFNSTACDYYTELDAVYLHGTTKPNTQPAENHSVSCTRPPEGSSVAIEDAKQKLSSLHLNGIKHDDGSSNCYFDTLPGEVIQEILRRLDFVSLCHAEQTCRLLRAHCCAPWLYSELTLQPFWTQVNNDTLTDLSNRCQHLQKLNLSWCGAWEVITTQVFNSFINVCSSHLIVLYLATCQFVDSDVISHISSCCFNLKDLDLHGCRSISSDGFCPIKKLFKLQRLNLYGTLITKEPLIDIIRSCEDLHDLNIGSCMSITTFHEILSELGKNCRNLRSLDMWRGAISNHGRGLQDLAEGCTHLEELDVGWCELVYRPKRIIIDVVSECKKLKKLFLTAWRYVNNDDLHAIGDNLLDLEQLDILATDNVTEEAVSWVVECCPKLRLFDVSFCGNISTQLVTDLTRAYPHLQIKQSIT